MSFHVGSSMVGKSQIRFNIGTNGVHKHGRGVQHIMKPIAFSPGLPLKANPLDPAKKQWMRHFSSSMVPGTLLDLDKFGLERIPVDERVFRQHFCIRSYETGADLTETVETLMNHLQETALDHVKDVGLLDDAFGSTPEMRKKNLFWVVTKTQVSADRYPTWGDVIQVNTWVAPSTKYGIRRDWVTTDCTGEIITRASSNFVMMNKDTRKLSRLPDEVRAEFQGYFIDAPPVIDDGNVKLPKLDESTAIVVRKGLTPAWSDLDVNRHVNNVKYVAWILEAAPDYVMEKYELANMTLEYRRECMMGNVLQSLTTSVENDHGGSDEPNHVSFQHLLRLENGGGDILKGKTTWRPKYEDIT